LRKGDIISYVDIRTQISTQQTQIQSSRKQIQQERIASHRGIQSLKRVHPRADPSVWEGRKTRIESIKTRLGELKSVEKQLDISESKLLEQEQFLKQKESEGWKIRETSEGKYELYKVTQVPGVVKPRGQVSAIKVHWINREGKTVTSLTEVDRLESVEQEIREVHGGRITKVETHEAAPHLKSRELWKEDVEALPLIVTEPVKTIEEIVKYTAVYEKIPERIVTKRFLPTPERFAEKRGLPTEVFAEYMAVGEVTTETRDMTQAEITESLSKMTKDERISWYKEHAQFGIEGEEKKSWAEIKKEQPDWDLTVKGTEAKILTPETDTGQLLKVMGEQYEKQTPAQRGVRYGSIGLLSLFRIETWIARYSTPGMGGVIKQAEETLRWEYQISKEDDPFRKWIAVQRPAYEHVIIPFIAGAGIGAAFKGIGLAAETATGTTSKVLHQFATKAPYVFGGVISTAVGADIGLTAARQATGDPYKDWTSKETLSKIFGYGVMFTSAGIGAHWVRGVHISESQLMKVEQARIQFNKSMSKLPGYEAAYEQISIFRVTGKYGALQDGVRYPSALYYGVRARMSMLRQPVDAFVARSALLRQQRMAFEPPIGLDQQYRLMAIKSPRTMTGAIRIQPRVGYALSTEAIASIAPRGGYLIRPPVEVMPKIFETSELIFTKKVPVKGGYLLEYMQETDIHYKPFTKGLPYEFEKMKGFGQIFKPDMPGTYTIGGRKVFIGATEAYDLFVGRKILLRTFGGRAERIGITRGVYAESKLRIPSELHVKAPITRIPTFKRGVPYYDTRGLPDLEKTPLTKTVQNIDQEFYKFFSATKQADMPGRTSFTLGLGRTQELYTIHSPLKAFKLTVSEYRTVGEVTPIKDITGITGKKIPVRGMGQVYDITEWYGTDYLKTPVTSYQQNIFTQLKNLRASHIVSSYAVSDVGTGKTLYPYAPAKQIVYDSPYGGRVIYDGVKTYAATSPFITTIAGVSPVVVKDVKPVSKQIDRTLPMMAHDARLEYATVTTQLERELTKLMPKQITKPMTRLEEKMVTRQLEKQITTPVTRQIERQVTKPVTKQITRLLEKQILKQITKEIMKVTTAYVPYTYDIYRPHIRPTVTETVPPIQPPPTVFGFLLDDMQKPFTPLEEPGYNVEVRGRHHFKGKKRMEGQFIKLSKRSISYENALSLGGAAVDSSAAATFKIVPTGSPAKNPIFKLAPFGNIQHKFYMKENKEIIEKRSFRMDTEGEIKNISALGWYAERIAKKKAVAVYKEKAKERRKVRDRDIFDMDIVFKEQKKEGTVFDFDPIGDFNKQMKNLFKM